MKKYIPLLCFSFFIYTAFGQLNSLDIQIPMRDGKNLAAHLYLPNETDVFSTILIQTPYNKNLFTFAGLPLGIDMDIENSDYAFVILDWRCFYGSLLACGLDIDRGQDGYDAVEWIAEQSWSNGKIGTWGPSALGNIQFQTAREQPPHLVCAVPEVPSPQAFYSKYYPGGSIRTEHLETLSLLFGNLGGIPTIINNPYYSLLWQVAEAAGMYPEDIQIPMFIIGGWYDHNTVDNFVMIDTLRKASALLVRDKHKILMGPWVHGGTGPAKVGTPQQGELSFPEAAFWNDSLALMCFDYYLRDVENGWEDQPPYLYFQMGDNVWQSGRTSGRQMKLFLNPSI